MWAALGCTDLCLKCFNNHLELFSQEGLSRTIREGSVKELGICPSTLRTLQLSHGLSPDPVLQPHQFPAHGSLNSFMCLCSCTTCCLNSDSHDLSPFPSLLNPISSARHCITPFKVRPSVICITSLSMCQRKTKNT